VRAAKNSKEESSGLDRGGEFREFADKEQREMKFPK
jgi:hypothetical protein